jgi:hypothetical protein
MTIRLVDLPYFRADQWLTRQRILIPFLQLHRMVRSVANDNRREDPRP